MFLLTPVKLFFIPSTLGVRASGGRVFIALAVRLNDADRCWWGAPSGFLAAVIANQDDGCGRS